MPQIGFIRAGVRSNFKSGWVLCGWNEHRRKLGDSMRRKNEFTDVALVEQHEGFKRERSSAASSVKSQAKTTSGDELMF